MKASTIKPSWHLVWGRGVLLLIAVATILFTLVAPAKAAGTPVSHGTTAFSSFAVETATETADNPDKDCSAGSLAWFLCPMTELIINSTDFIQNNLIIPYLTVSPLSTDSGNAVYRLWEVMRNVGNVLFILGFFFIIFSQATSIGLSNYGIKRMLPKLVWVAIVANVSYYLVAFAIDLFNILGAGVGGLVMGIIGTAGSNGSTASGDVGNFLRFSIPITVLTIGATMGWIWPLIGSIFLIVLVAVIVLVLRQMLIILLAILTPLLAVAMLLPNTEKYGSKGWDLLFKLLMMYPIIILLFAIGKIVGALITSGDVQLANGQFASQGVADIIKQVFAAGAAAIPLLLIPATFAAAGSLIKGAFNTVQSRTQGWANSGRKAYESSTFGQYRQQKTKLREQEVSSGNYSGWRPGAKLQSAINRRLNRSNLYNAATQGYGGNRALMDSRQRRAAREETAKLFNNDYELAEAWIASGGNMNSTQYAALKSPAQKQIFAQLVRSGFDKTAESHTAAMELIASQGRGNGAMLLATEAQINRFNPGSAVTDINAMRNTVNSAWRNSGRGDISVNIVPKPTSTDPLEKTAVGKPQWSAVSKFSRHVLDPSLTGASGGFKRDYINQDGEAINAITAAADPKIAAQRIISNAEKTYRDYLDASPQANVRKMVEALPQLEARDRRAAEVVLFDYVRGKKRSVYGGGAGDYADTAADMGAVMAQLREDFKLQAK